MIKIKYLLVFFSLVLSAFVYFFTLNVFQNQIGGYDLSPLIDCAYRISKNEIPYIDFINTLPLSMIGWMKISLYFIPNNWNFLLLTSLYHYYFALISILIIYYNTRWHENKKYLFSLILLSITIPIIITNHIWHSIFTQLNAVLVVLSTSFIIIEEKPKKILYLILFFFFGILFFSKQNVGFLICASIFPILFLHNKLVINKKLLKVWTILILSILFYYFLFISLFKFSFSFHEIVSSFFGISGRAIPQKDQLIEVFYLNKINLFLLLLFLIISLIIVLKIKKNYRETLFIFHFTIQFISYFAFLTDWDIKFNNLPILITSDLICLFFLFKLKDNVLNSLLIFVFLFFIYSIFLGATRYRMQCVGYGTFFENTKLTQIESGYFKGLKTTPKFMSINNEIQLNISKNDKIFFGPRMEWAYAQYNLSSPTKMPLWWHPGSSFPLNDTNAIYWSFKKNNFNKLILLKNDRTRIPSSIIKYIDDNAFFIRNQTKYLDIYIKR